MGTNKGDDEVLSNDNEKVGILETESMNQLECDIRIQKSPKNAQNRPKIWDIYKKLGIENGEIGAQTECGAKLGDIMVKNVNSDLTVVSDAVKNVPSENAQNCPKNWDIYKKLGINIEEKSPIEKNMEKDYENPPVAGKMVVPGLEELEIKVIFQMSVKCQSLGTVQTLIWGSYVQQNFHLFSTRFANVQNSA